MLVILAYKKGSHLITFTPRSMWWPLIGSLDDERSEGPLLPMLNGSGSNKSDLCSRAEVVTQYARVWSEDQDYLLPKEIRIIALLALSDLV